MTEQATLFDAGALERAGSVQATSTPRAAANPVLRRCSGSSGHPGACWRAWTKDTDEEHAAAAFFRRYGVHPEFVIDGIGGLLLVGPVPGMEV